MKTTFKVKQALRFICVVVLMSCSSLAQEFSSCESGEVGVFVSMQYTELFSTGEVSWDIQDSNGDTLEDFEYSMIGANFLYESDEICLPEGEIYTFNTYDAGGDGWGLGSWYELSICGGNTPLINNSGNAPTGSGGSESFSLPFVTDNCFCFSLDLEQSSASSATSADGSIITIPFAGNPPFTYEWSNGATTENLNNVAPGVYFVTITDSLGCELTEMAEVQGPDIYMGNGNEIVCTGYFYDSGGSNGNFAANENYTFTICSDSPDLSSVISFYSFNLTGSAWSSPTMIIYDGETTTSPVLYSYNGAGDPPPGNIVATDDNESGCLTISFSSGNNVSDGWFAEIDCQYPCQDFTVQIESSDLINPLGQLEACYDIDLNALTDYPNNDQYYTQEDNTTSFYWVFGDNQVSDDQSVTYLYAELDTFDLSLVATDVNGCTAETSIEVINDAPGVMTSIFPPEDNEVCPETIVEVGSSIPGTDSVIYFFSPVTWVISEEPLNVGEDFGDPIYLPDGDGDVYTTTVNIQAFDTDAILDDDDFQEICVEIEHSHLGDLDMSLTSPNGTTVLLFNTYGSTAGGTYLGDPIDDTGDGPNDPAGECWEYCWSVEPQFGTFPNSLGNTMGVTIEAFGSSMIPGLYAPEGNFSNFEGSPANGLWTLSITDNWAIDNGFICSWNITMNVVGEEDEVIIDSLVPEILSYGWYCEEEPSSIVTFDSTMVVVQPTTPGIHTYVMSLSDSYGCDYTEEFILDVYSTPETGPNLVSECEDQFNLEVTNVPPGGGYWEWIDGPDDSSLSFDPDTNSFTPEITVSEVGDYTFVFTENDCGLSNTVSVDVQVVDPIIDDPEDVICVLDNSISVIDPTGNGGVWTVFSSDTSANASIADASMLETNLSVDNFGTYQVAFTVDFCFGTDTMDVNFITIDPFIYNPGVQVCDWEVELEANNPSPTDGFWELLSQPNHTSAEISSFDNPMITMEVDDFGGYQMAYTINGCETSDTIMVQFGQAIPQLNIEEFVRCDFDAILEVESFGMEEGWGFVDGPAVPVFSDPLSFETDLEVPEYGDYTLMYTGCDTSVLFNVLFMCDLETANSFSPNGDGYNDLFTIEDLTYEYYSYSNMSIYNRWGDEVYKNGHYGLDGSWWDGKNTHQYDQLAPGVYFYVLKVGNKVTQEEDVYKGVVNLFY
tara:strand:+ start:12745 stop:16266 length:3522 start_codon:yes stop_codon:yes gene_type:complete